MVRDGNARALHRHKDKGETSVLAAYNEQKKGGQRYMERCPLTHLPVIGPGTNTRTAKGQTSVSDTSNEREEPG